MPALFDDIDSFKVWFKGVDWEALKASGGSKGRVVDMHTILRPFLLRRLKRDVDLALPSKKEILLSVGAAWTSSQLLSRSPLVQACRRCRSSTTAWSSRRTQKS